MTETKPADSQPSAATDSAPPEEWAPFRESALQQGFPSVHAIPVRPRETTIGTLNLLRETVGELDTFDATAAQAFTDVATIGILHERSLRNTSILAELPEQYRHRRRPASLRTAPGQPAGDRHRQCPVRR
jgi:hypothetical protein